MKDVFWQLDKLGRTRLSEHFQFRQFLYSEIAAAFGIPNIPDDPQLAIQTGTKLCKEILEPVIAAFGPIIVRSGFRSAMLNQFGNENGLMCAANEKNFAYHIWDHRDADGNAGAAACIIVPALNEGRAGLSSWQDLASWIDNNLDYHRLTFFARDNAFNIGWHENPRREIYSRTPEPHWFKR